MIISSLLMDYVAPLFPVYDGSRLLAALCMGVLCGIGYAMIFMRGSSTGGQDFISVAIKKVKPHITLGIITFVLHDHPWNSTGIQGCGRPDLRCHRYLSDGNGNGQNHVRYR